MSNYAAFNKEYLQSIVEPFLPNAASYITPIKFEALSPDIFAFLFRTVGNDKRQHFFVVLEFDYLENLKEAQKLIKEWHGSFEGFWRPDGQEEKDTDGMAEASITVDHIYKAVLAKVEPPASPSYWSDVIVLWPDDDITPFLDNFHESQRENVSEQLTRIRKEYPKVSVSVHFDGSGKVHFYYG